MTRWIDIHTHLDMLEAGAEEGLRQALSAGVDRLITIGTNPKDHPIVLELAEKYKPQVYCTLGVHPHEAELYSQEVGEFIEREAQSPRVVAIGEIGLDYYYDHAPRERQKQVFADQLEIAVRLKLPVEIHTRDADQDTVDILNSFKGRVSGVFHCFTGTEWLAREALNLGFDLSFSGVVTFKNAEALRDICRWAPLDRIHVETDAPFLAPVPQRGKKNQPAYVVHTAEFVAQLKGLSPAELAEAVRQNAQRLFPRIQF